VISGKLPLDVQTVQFARVIEARDRLGTPAIEAKGLALRVVLDTEGVLPVSGAPPANRVEPPHPTRRSSRPAAGSIRSCSSRRVNTSSCA